MEVTPIETDHGGWATWGDYTVSNTGLILEPSEYKLQTNRPGPQVLFSFGEPGACLAIIPLDVEVDTANFGAHIMDVLAHLERRTSQRQIAAHSFTESVQLKLQLATFNRTTGCYHRAAA